MKTAGKVILVLSIVVAAYFGIKWLQNRNAKKVSGGAEPGADEKLCASGGSNLKTIIGSCTKPLFITTGLDVKEKCFTSASLNLDEGDLPWPEVVDANGFGKRWYFNYQSGDKFCYVDKQVLAP